VVRIKYEIKLFLNAKQLHFVGNPPTFRNFIFTIEGFLLLREELTKCGFKYFKARQFQQDALENFFGRIRQKGHRNVNPSCSYFGPIYKSCLLNDLVSKHSLGANCEDDGGKILMTLERFFKEVVTNIKIYY